MKYKVQKIEHNYNQIWNRIKANKNIVVSYNFTDVLGMDLHILGDITFTNLLEDPNIEYVTGSSHISGEDNIPQA